MKIKKTFIFILCALAAVSASFFPVAGTPAAEAATGDNKDYFQYDTYEAGGYYEINYYLDICEDTAQRIGSECASVGGKGIDNLFDSIERFFYAYEFLFFNKAHAGFRRNKNAEEYDSVSNPFYSFNMYIYFESDDEMSASQKYREYFGFGEGTPVPPKKGFFADKYEVQDITHFYVPNMLAVSEGRLVTVPMYDYDSFDSSYFTYESLRGMASLNTVMMPFLLYGKTGNNGFADHPDKKINFEGLVNLFPGYFEGRTLTRSGFFSNYLLYHSMSLSTVYLKTDADSKSGFIGSFGEYTQAWEVSYAVSSADYRYANRTINITYIEPKIINMYFLAMIIAASFIALMLLCFYGLPKIINKEKNQQQRS